MTNWSEHTKRLHEARTNGSTSFPDLDEPELASAWHALQLHWLRTVPGYRQEIRERVAEAARQAEKRARIIEGYRERPDVDRLGPEVEGCG